jgi:SAM-dependent methyltransferase
MRALGIKYKILKKLREGITIPYVHLVVKVDVRMAQQPTNLKKGISLEHSIGLRKLQRLIKLFPELSLFYHSSVETQFEDCKALLDFYHSFSIPLIYKPAKETHLRNLLFCLQKTVHDDGFKNLIAKEIAKSNLRSGVPERATELLHAADDSPNEQALATQLRNDIDEYEKRYESKAGLIRTIDLWRKLPGDTRGISLAFFFKQNRDQLKGKRILHIAPEAELKKWFEAERSALRTEYRTLDAFGDSGDLRQDICALALENDFVDVVICHRVLEHILDDSTALSEIHRVLKPGGFLNVSVPQSMQMETTNEWVIPDLTQHGHVRQYGRDFERRLQAAGFRVAVEYCLLNRTVEEHVADGSYPMRIYTCTKPNL